MESAVIEIKHFFKIYADDTEENIYYFQHIDF